MRIPTIENESFDALVSLVEHLVEDYIDNDIYEVIMSGDIYNDTYDYVDSYVIDVVRKNVSNTVDRVLDAFLTE